MAIHSNILARIIHGQRSLLDYRSHKESDTTEHEGSRGARMEEGTSPLYPLRAHSLGPCEFS